jgi:hypothetical protein
VEPPHIYLQDRSSPVVHHQDYLSRRDDRTLCGVVVEIPTQLGATDRPDAVCPDCEAKLVEYHLKWWRERAEAATAELDELRVKFRELTARADSEAGDVADQVEVGPDSDAEIPGSADQGQTTPTPLLDQARRELLDLCRRFDDAVPYWRVKNTMDAFSDKLDSDERVLLAQEIGADGSLIRWCTAEIEGLGWRVTNNPVSGEAEDMMDAWTHDLYQTPKKTKWRLGRSR